MTGGRTLWAQFASGDEIVAAARALRARGKPLVEAYTPYPLPELERSLSTPYPISSSRITFLGACVGGTLAFLVIWWTASIDYPLNVGGRPLNSVIADIPIVFESAVLGATFAAFASFLWLSRLLRLTHPFEHWSGFRETSVDRFWLGVHAPRDELAQLSGELRELGALGVQAEEER